MVKVESNGDCPGTVFLCGVVIGFESLANQTKYFGSSPSHSLHVGCMSVWLELSRQSLL